MTRLLNLTTALETNNPETAGLVVAAMLAAFVVRMVIVTAVAVTLAMTLGAWFAVGYSVSELYFPPRAVIGAGEKELMRHVGA